MPNEKFEWLRRVKAVEREYTAMRFMTDSMLKSLEEQTLELEEGLKRLDITRSSERLEGTYTIRLFSEFEVSLKAFLRAQRLRRVPRDAKPLIDRVATHVRFSGPILNNVHEVRLYRNRLVHELVHGIPP